MRSKFFPMTLTLHSICTVLSVLEHPISYLFLGPLHMWFPPSGTPFRSQFIHLFLLEALPDAFPPQAGSAPSLSFYRF